MRILAVVTITLVLLTSTHLVPVFSTEADGRVEVIVEFDSAYTDLNLIYLKLAGYDLSLVDKLHHVMNGAVIEIDESDVAKLRNEIIVSNVYEQKKLKANLDRSVKLVGIDETLRSHNGMEITGKGVRVAVVDTGIDYTHPDLHGFGEDGKVVGGYDFLERDNEPMDTDGHGTLVAGIIAADGKLKGLAPDAELVAYRIASEGDYVSTTDMIRALDRAIDDQIDIMNISLGLDYISEEIDSAIEKLISKGIVVVTAAGNNGQESKIGSPASAPNAISVGATLNNVTLSAVSSLRIEGDSSKYNTTPMFGSVVPSTPVSGKLVFGGYATEKDLRDIDVRDAIVLAERGGPFIEVDGKMETQLVYFTEKEFNAAEKGAAALIVYNNVPGDFAGTLVNELAGPDYRPRIPVVSMPMEDGLALREKLQSGDSLAELNIFLNPDVVASFSSVGPVSPFYLKPTLVAPGAFINSTGKDGSYSMSSGTSFASPHVAGAAALLLQKNPDLTPDEIASLLANTAVPINDTYDSPYPFDVSGAGRLDVVKALNTDLVASPYYVILHLAPGKAAFKEIEISSLKGELGPIDIELEWDESIPLDAKVTNLGNETATILLNARLSEELTGKYQGRLWVESEQGRISIPVLVQADAIGLDAKNKDGMILLSIESEEDWTFAKVKVVSVENRRGYSGTLTPSDNLLTVPARTVGEHWIEADVLTNDGDVKGFSVLQVSDIAKDGFFYDHLEMYGIPLKEASMIASFLGIAAAVVYVWRNRVTRTSNIVNEPSMNEDWNQ